jgi:hypothetical protein
MNGAADEIFVRYLTEDSISIEDAVDAAKAKIYIILTNTKTAFSKVASLITRQNYNHISLSFDRDLKELFTFDLGENSIMVETIDKFDPLAEFIIYSIDVTMEALHRIRERISYMIKNSRSFVYSRLTLLKATINQLTGVKIFEHDETLRNEYICSTFVAEILRIANVKLFRDDRIPAPHDFKGNRALKYEFRGTFRSYAKRLGLT